MSTTFSYEEAMTAPSTVQAPGASQGKTFTYEDAIATDPAPAAPQRTTGEELGRQVGLTVRHAVNGVAAIPAMAANVVAGAANKGLDLARGEGNGFRFPDQAKALDGLMTKAGLPQPENAMERVVGDATSALAGTGGVVKAGQALAGGVNMAAQVPGAATVSQHVGNALALNPQMQAVSAAASAGAAGGAREVGAGEGAQMAAGLAGALVPGVIRPQRVLDAGGRQTRAAAMQAHADGYVIPPADLSPNLKVEALNGFGGKIKTAQEASARNQTVSNKMAKRALGLPDDADLSIETLEGLRKSAAAAYEPVANSGMVTPGKAYNAALDSALKPFKSQTNSFPGAKPAPVVAELEALRTGQFDAGDGMNMIRTLREAADRSYRAGENMAGKAYKQGAGAIEDALEGHLKALGQPAADVLQQFREARQTIAKTYTVQGALNPQTGAVNAVKLAADLAKNKPLTGELRKVAEFGRAFPKAAQALKEAPNSTSPLDWGAGLLAAASTGNVLPMAGVAARPIARNALLSKAAQRNAVSTAGTKIQRVNEATPAIVLGALERASAATPAPEKIYTNRVEAGYVARMTGGVVVPTNGGFHIQAK